MSRTVPSGSASAHSANTAPSEKSETGPAAETAIRRRRGSNHASRRVHERVREDRDRLQPGAIDPAPERRHRQPVRESRARRRPRSARAGTPGRPAELRRDHERRPVAARDQRDERRQPGDDQHRQRDQHRPREEHPAAAPVDAPRSSARCPVKTFSRGLTSLLPADSIGASASGCPPATPSRNPRSPRSDSSRASRAGPGRRRSAARTARPARPASACRRAAGTAPRRCRTAAGTSRWSRSRSTQRLRPSDASSRLSA